MGNEAIAYTGDFSKGRLVPICPRIIFKFWISQVSCFEATIPFRKLVLKVWCRIVSNEATYAIVSGYSFKVRDIPTRECVARSMMDVLDMQIQ